MSSTVIEFRAEQLVHCPEGIARAYGRPRWRALLRNRARSIIVLCSRPPDDGTTCWELHRVVADPDADPVRYRYEWRWPRGRWRGDPPFPGPAVRGWFEAMPYSTLYGWLELEEL